MTVNFSHKKINVEFSLGSGSFGSGGNSYTATGLRVTCHMEIKGGKENSQASIAIFGMPLQIMNQLTTFGNNFMKQGQDTVTVYAGDAQGMSMVFKGQIWQAFVDGKSQPWVAFRVQAGPGALYNVKPQTPITFNGPTPPINVVNQVAKNMGMTVKDNGVGAMPPVTNPYHDGDA